MLQMCPLRADESFLQVELHSVDYLAAGLFRVQNFISRSSNYVLKHIRHIKLYSRYFTCTIVLLSQAAQRQICGWHNWNINVELRAGAPLCLLSCLMHETKLYSAEQLTERYVKLKILLEVSFYTGYLKRKNIQNLRLLQGKLLPTEKLNNAGVQLLIKISS